MNVKSFAGTIRVRQWVQQEEHVPTPAELIEIVEDRAGQHRPGRHRHRDDAAPPIGLADGGAVRGDCAPVVADDDGVAVAAERLVQPIGVVRQRTDLVDTVGGQRRRRVAAHERRDPR